MVDGERRRLVGEAVTAGVLTISVFLVATAVIKTDSTGAVGLISMILGYSLAHSIWNFL